MRPRISFRMATTLEAEDSLVEVAVDGADMIGGEELLSQQPQTSGMEVIILVRSKYYILVQRGFRNWSCMNDSVRTTQVRRRSLVVEEVVLVGARDLEASSCTYVRVQDLASHAHKHTRTALNVYCVRRNSSAWWKCNQRTYNGSPFLFSSCPSCR